MGPQAKMKPAACESLGVFSVFPGDTWHSEPGRVEGWPWGQWSGWGGQGGMDAKCVLGKRSRWCKRPLWGIPKARGGLCPSLGPRFTGVAPQ